MTREYKTFSFEMKTSDDELGVITGYLSVFNHVDQGMDMVMKGAFKRTLANSKKRAKDANNAYIFPMLWQHKDTEPIGGVTEAIEDEYGLLTTAQFDLDTQRGREAYSGYKKGYLNQLSIGYDVIKKSYDEKGIRHLEELRLWEQSTVTFAMNEDALVTDVKARKNTMPPTGKKDFDSHYQDAQAQGVLSDFWDFGYALKQSAIDAWTLGDTPLPDAEAAWNQAKPAFMAWMQRGIDCNMKDFLGDQSSSSSSYYGYMSGPGATERKGGMSQAKKETIQSHVDDLHDLADDHLTKAKKHAKALHNAADDLASVLGNSEPAYTTDPGTPEKSASLTRHAEHKDHSSSVDTDLDAALAQLALLRLSNN